MLLVGSTNQHKIREIRALLHDVNVRVVGSDALPPGPEIEETGETFAVNVRIKAIEYARRAAALLLGTDHPATIRHPAYVVADDSGLCVDALGGDPGVQSARYAGDGCSYPENNRKLLRALAGVPDGRRHARFVCAIACARVPQAPSEEPEVLFVVEGQCRGRITAEERGSGGFGYDPLFIEETAERTFAELSPAEKNLLSHRGRALRKFRERFLDLPCSTGEGP